MLRSPKTTLFPSVTVALLLLCSGCSAFRSTMQTVTFDASVPGANIAIDGNDHGVAPVTLEIRRNAYMTIVVSKAGYKTKVATPRPRMSKTGVADALGGYLCLCPGIGLLTPGAWEFKPDYIVFDLEPKTPQPPSEPGKAPLLPQPEEVPQMPHPEEVPRGSGQTQSALDME